jgi:hypothetical protein
MPASSTLIQSYGKHILHLYHGTLLGHKPIIMATYY